MLAVLGYSTTNNSSKAYYDTNTYATVEVGSNARTVQFLLSKKNIRK